MNTSGFQRWAVRVLELSEGVETVAGLEGYAGVHLLICLEGRPLGTVRCQSTEDACTATVIYDAIETGLAGALAAALLTQRLSTGLPPGGLRPVDLAYATEPCIEPPSPRITVAVCTRERPADLAACLAAIAALDYPEFEVLVVDNAPKSDAAQPIALSFAGVRYVVEPRPGLTWARNRAIAECRTEIIAFADDDVRVHSGWLRGLAKAFNENPDAVAVTGLVVSANLNSYAQELFEHHGGFSRGYRPLLVRADPDDPLLWQNYGTGRFGTGANMAFRHSIFDSIGRFDPALDVGTVTHGGGDLEFLFRVLREGYALAYEPTAICLHRHRESMRELRRQIFNNGIGWVSACCRCGAAYPDAAGKLFHVVAWWAWRGSLQPLLRSLWKSSRTPRGLRLLWLLDIAGYIAGLPAYWRSRRQQRRRGQRDDPSAAPLWPDRTHRKLRSGNTEFRAAAVRTAELTRPVTDAIVPADYAHTRFFATIDGVPVGDVSLTNLRLPVSPRLLRAELASRLFDRLSSDPHGADTAHRWEQFTSFARARFLDRALAPGHAVQEFPDTAAAASPAPSVSIVVPTADRPVCLRECLTALINQKYAGTFEIVVADNRPDSGITEPVVAEFANVQYVAESRPGVAYARNRGTAACSGEIIVYADDDTVAPTKWLSRLSVPFARDEVAAVSGNVLPLTLDTGAQVDFELYGALGRGYRPWNADRAWFDSHHRKAVATWQLGGTANLAVRASVLCDPAIGLQREELGPGTPTGVGEDIYLFYSLLKNGHIVAYSPAGWLWHRHRATRVELRRQLYGYSKGFVAYNLVTLLRDRDRRALWTLLWHLPGYDLKRIWRFLRRAMRPHSKPGYPLSLQLWEIAGHLAGPWALWRSLRRVRKLGRSAPLDAGSAPVRSP